MLGITSWRLMSARQHSAAFPATGRSVFSGVPSSRTDARLRQCSQQPSSLMCSVCRHNTASTPASSSSIERDSKEVASPHLKTRSQFLLCLTPSRSTVPDKCSPQTREKLSHGHKLPSQLALLYRGASSFWMHADACTCKAAAELVCCP
jgi:hypothetical protein